MEKLINHYEVFNQMVLSTTLLGNNVEENWKIHSANIISFLGEAYNLPAHLIYHAQEIIINDISSLFLVSDANYIFNTNTKSNTFIYETKAKTILFLQAFYSEQKPYFLNYTHRNNFYPEIHFRNINEASRYGHFIACRQLGILYALGIGVEKNYDKALLKLKQSAYWGDITSIYLITYIYKLLDDSVNYNIYLDLIKLMNNYFKDGITIVTDKSYNKKAVEIFTLIASIFQDVVKLHKNKHLIIDYSFVEVMLLDRVSINEKHRYINDYVYAKWRDASNNPNKFKTTNNFGFLKED